MARKLQLFNSGINKMCHPMQNIKRNTYWGKIKCLVFALCLFCCANTFLWADTPQITSGPDVYSVSNTTATIVFDTNVPTYGKVEFGLDTNYGKEATNPFVTTAVTHHSISLPIPPDLLEPNSLYHFRVVANTINIGEQPAVSADNIFQTEDAYFGTDLVQGQATGFFHLEKIDGRDWLLAPHGKGVYYLGINAVYLGMEVSAFQSKYNGNEYYWAEKAIRDLKKWNSTIVGDRSSGTANNTASWSRFPYTVMMDFINNEHGNRKYPYSAEDPWHDYPDPWDINFITSMEEMVKERIIKRISDPYFVGYFVCNEPDLVPAMPENAWWNRWLRATIDRSAGSSGKEVYINMLIEKYKTIEEFNNTYSSSYSSFDEVRNSLFHEIYGSKEYPYNSEPGQPDQLQDLHNFNRKIAEQFFSTAFNFIRSYDPNHLILGHKLAGGLLENVDELIQESGKYTDIFSVNEYCYELDSNRIDKFSSLSGKPILISEFSFLEEGYHSGEGGTYPSSQDQVDRGNDYETYLMSAINFPNIIGVSWHSYIDPWDEEADYLNFGWLNRMDEEYSGFVDLAKDTNQNIYASVLDKTPPTIENVTPLNQSFIKGLINVNVSVKDEGSGVSHIELYFGKLKLASDYTEPFEAVFDTTLYSDQILTLTLKAYDKVGNVGETGLTYTVDNTPPTPATPQIPEQNALLKEKNVTFSWLAGSDLNFDKYILVLDGKQVAETTETSITIPDISDGLHTWSIITVDKAENQTPSDEFSFSVDDTDPTVVSTQPLNNAQDQPIDVSVSLTFSEKLDLTSVISANFSVEGSVSGVHTISPSAEYIEGKTVVNLNVEGVFKKGETVTVRLLGGIKDIAGNYAPPYEFSFQTILPEEISIGGITIQDKSSGNNQFANELSIVLNAQNILGNPVFMMISEDSGFTGASWISFVNPTEYVLSSGDGNKTIYYKLKNTDEVESNIVNNSIVLDTTLPTVPTLEIPANNSYVNVLTPTFKWSKVEEINLLKYQLFIDDSLILETEENEITITSPLSEANHSWKIVALDKAENTSVSDVWSFMIDITPPMLTIISPVEGEEVKEIILLNAEGNDIGSGIKQISAYIDGELFGSDLKSPYQGNWDSTTVSNGLHIIKAEAVDLAGNISIEEITIIVSNNIPKTPPKIERVNAGNQLDANKSNYISSTPKVSVKVSNSKKVVLKISGPSIFEFNSDHPIAPQSINTQSWDGKESFEVNILESLPSGIYKLEVTAENEAGDIITETFDNLIVTQGQGEIASGTLPLAYPNPFSPIKYYSVDFTYTLTANTDVTLYIFNSNAQLIAKKLYSSGTQGGIAGFNRVSWNGKTDFGETISAGAYIIKIVVDKKVIGTIKLAVIY
jgi:hypothetical protein